ncbi:MAG: adenylate/guanylate cyclase domain-containing protein [Candidatus Cloacimonadota bacterium]|nr:adenylate/guanylate cyclase domain-containing protein [Candidatus Cloacimonadota bacterium]
MRYKKQTIRLIKLYKKWYALLIASLLLTLLVSFFNSTPFSKDMEMKMLDYRFQLDPTLEKADTNIVIIAIDDSSLDFFSENGISWPWPRSFYGYVVDYLTEAGARTVIFDMQFYEKDIEREETTADETDNIFADAIKNNGKVYLGAQLLKDKNKIHPKVDDFSIDDQQTDLPPFQGIRAPIAPFLLNNRSIGVINTEPDNDGLIRKVGLLFKLKEHYFAQMAYRVWLDQYQDSDIVEIPVDNNGDYLLNWYGRSAFRTYPFRALISSASAYMNDHEPIIPLEALYNKHIIIGATAAGLYDLKSNSYSKVIPGMEIWATALSNYINHDFITTVPNWFNFLITLLIVFLIMFLISNFLPQKANIIVLLLLILMLFVNFILWKFYRIQLNFTMQIFGFIISYLLINTLSYLLEGKSRREIRKIFTRYLHNDVIKQLEDDPNKVQLGGKEINATVLYTDIYNFTTLSETKTPSELVQDLNEYFKTLIDFVFQYEGLLDKYTGDGIMALFGAPIERNDHALLACRTAFAHKRLREELEKKQDLTATEKLHLQTRIGINSGHLVAGNIGGEKRMDYTAIGDTVNLAARLEGVNKLYQTNIIISQTTYEQIKENFICRELDSLMVKGKTKPTCIFEIIDERTDETDPSKYEWIKIYNQALELYRKGKWQEAGELFQDLSEEPYNDNASQVLLTRCMYLLEFPPKDWDGVLRLDVK